ncbi:MAG: hypothetical protein K0S01_2447 [Herbinix sp.]|jgi:hypothetical protein|nr:hypothetical protein [Herbinix sp.]
MKDGYMVLVIANDRIIEKVKSLSFGYFETSPINNNEYNNWTIICCDNNFNTNGYKKISVQPLGEPENTMLLNVNIKTIIFEHQLSEQWIVQNITRMVRALLRLQCYESGALFVHGGLVNYLDKGIAFIGHKKSGKTSSILSLLSFDQTSFVSNDDISFSIQNDEWIAEGWPRSIVVRQDTLEVLCDQIELDLEMLKHPLNKYNNENANNNTICFYPDEFSNIFSKSTMDKCSLNYLIFPCFSPRNESSAKLTRLSLDNALNVLNNNILLNPEKYIDHLLPYFNLPNLLTLKDITRKIVSAIPCYSLEQSFSNLKEGSLKIQEMIKNDMNVFE